MNLETELSVNKSKAKPKALRQVMPQELGFEFVTVKNTFNITPEREKYLIEKHFQKYSLPKGVKSIVELVHQGRDERAYGF